MMDCSNFEMMLADAIGGELSEEDQAVLDVHLAGCDRCRLDLESARDTVETMRSLPGPQQVSIRRDGDRLVIEDRGAVAPTARMFRGFMRYAAGFLIAFTGGYACHAFLIARDAIRQPTPIVKVEQQQTSLEGSLVNARAGKPRRTKLASCLIAMSTRTP